MNSTHCIHQFQSNCAYLAEINPALAKALIAEAKLIEILEDCEINHLRLRVEAEIWLDDIAADIDSAYEVQDASPERVRFQRFRASTPTQSVTRVLDQLVDTEELVTIDQLPNLQADLLPDEAHLVNQPLARNIILLGALSLLYIPNLLSQSFPIQSIVLVESEATQLAAVLYLLDLAETVTNLKMAGVGFDLIFHPNGDSLGARVLDHYGSSNPLALYGLWIYRSPRLSPSLIELQSWFHSSDGLLDHAKGFLGNDTDEFNQLIHAFWNARLYPSAKLLTPDILPDHYPLLIVASGPSLDDQIEWLKQYHQSFVILTAGSALGALLKAGIHVDACVLLEMGSLVYRDISDLVCEGYKLDDILLIGSTTIDPRIASHFKSHCFFHRPLSTAYALYDDEDFALLPQAGPQAANAAIEVALQLGSRRILLLGCDFAAANPQKPRAFGAMGSSDRCLDLPVKGSLGRTVFSSAELSTTRQLFENIIHLYGCYAVSLGEGAWMKGVIARDTMSPDEIVKEFGSDRSSFEHALEALRHRSVDLRQMACKLHQAQDWGNQRSSSIYNLLTNNTSWSHQLAKQLGTLVSWNDGGLVPAQKLRHRLTRFLYFCALQPLHDTSLESEWPERVSELQLSFQQINEIYSSLLMTLQELAGADTLPGWDAEWMRARLKKQALIS